MAGGQIARPLAMALYLVATPIGNLEDISPRALAVLGAAALVAAEDTRVTKKLFARYGIRTPLLACHQYSDPRKIAPILAALRAGRDVAVVTDAGTPGISDPGDYLVAQVLRELPTARVSPIPGPAALAAALSVSGLRAMPFTFFGFPPAKKGRRAFFAALAGRKETLVFYESPHRIQKTLSELRAALGDSRRAYVGRELTKLYESHYRGTLDEVTEKVKADRIKGEYVIIIATE